MHLYMPRWAKWGIVALLIFLGITNEVLFFAGVIDWGMSVGGIQLLLAAAIFSDLRAEEEWDEEMQGMNDLFNGGGKDDE